MFVKVFNNLATEIEKEISSWMQQWERDTGSIKIYSSNQTCSRDADGRDWLIITIFYG